MFKIPYEDIVSKITEKTNLTPTEIELRVKEKMKVLSGLISKEGAAYIIANELGVKVVEQQEGKLQIKNILAGMRNVETIGRVQQVYEVKEFVSGERRGKVGAFLLADSTGVIRVVCWNEQTSLVKTFKQNDLVKIEGAYVKENNGKKEIHVNDRTKLIKDPRGETIPELTLAPPEKKRKPLHELSEEDSDVEIVGTIVQAFDPRFYEICPQCSKRARPKDAQFACDAHGEVTPAYGYVMNLLLDDGTDTIRVVLFRNVVDQLLEIDSTAVLAYKDNLGAFESLKQNLLGESIKINGRVTKNTMFDRLEFIAQAVTKTDPEEEITRLQRELDDESSFSRTTPHPRSLTGDTKAAPHTLTGSFINPSSKAKSVKQEYGRPYGSSSSSSDSEQEQFDDDPEEESIM
ncbi:DUF2240 family protein [Candidatus Woesearchaeota archaeon]|nr:DUF2240 family protein [Candidatus Woesearchaeota archaeon]